MLLNFEIIDGLKLTLLSLELLFFLFYFLP